MIRSFASVLTIKKVPLLRNKQGKLYCVSCDTYTDPTPQQKEPLEGEEDKNSQEEQITREKEEGREDKDEGHEDEFTIIPNV